MNSGELIKKIREKLNMTQSEFANKIGCKQNTLSQYENNKAIPSVKIGVSIVRLANQKKIKLTLEELFQVKNHE